MEYRVKNPPEAGWEEVETKKEAFRDRLVEGSIMPLVVGQGGYDRVEITTTDGDKAYMYVGKEYNDQSEKSSDTASGQPG